MHFLRSFLLFSLIHISSFLQSQPYGNSIVLDGATNYIEVPNHPNINVTNELTIEAWINPCIVTGNNMITTKLWCSGAQNSYYFTVKDGKLRWVWFNSACGIPGNIYESSQPIILPNQWQHIAIVHTTSNVSLFLNGQPVAASLIQGNYGPLKLSSEPLRIGSYRFLGGGYSLFFSGQIDEFRFWNTAQSTSNILSRYNSPLTGNEPNLMAYFDMNNTIGGAGIVIPNNSFTTGSALNGTSYGTTSTPYYKSTSDNFLLGPDTTLCPNTQIILNANIHGSNYHWQNGSTNPTFTVSQPGTYYVSYTNNCGTNSDTINISYDSLPQTNLGNDTSICMGDTLVYDVFSNGSTYSWSSGANSAILSISTPGTYWVNVSNLCGISTDTVLINLSNPSPIIDLGADTTLCENEILILNPNVSNVQYLWQDSSTTSTFNVSNTGTYWVKVTNNCGSNSDTINVNFNPIPNIDLGNDTLFYNDFILDVTFPGATYLWNDNSSKSQLTITQPGIYWVKVSNHYCSESDTIIIYVLENLVELELPNIFTPNQDYINDYFTPVKLNGINQLRIDFYDKWGNLIYTSKVLANIWDGRNLTGNIVANGNYYWIATYIDYLGNQHSQKGIVQILY